jgi:hypothetical protein
MAGRMLAGSCRKAMAVSIREESLSGFQDLITVSHASMIRPVE